MIKKSNDWKNSTTETKTERDLKRKNRTFRNEINNHSRTRRTRTTFFAIKLIISKFLTCSLNIRMIQWTYLYFRCVNVITWFSWCRFYFIFMCNDFYSNICLCKFHFNYQRIIKFIRLPSFLRNHSYYHDTMKKRKHEKFVRIISKKTDFHCLSLMILTKSSIFNQ